MNKRNTLNLGLFVFILIVAAIAFFDDGDSEKNKKPAITKLKQTDVINITVRREGKQTIYLEKQHGQWNLIRPYNTPTNQFRMDTLLRLVETIPQSSYPLKEKQKFGLNTPKLEVLFNHGHDNAVSISFGDSEPIKMRRYVAVNDTLHITNDTYFYALNSVATDYINHKLLPEGFEISQLELPDLKLQFEQNNWKVTPQPEQFSMDDVNEFISEWKNVQAIDIKPFNSKIKTSVKNTIKIFGENATTLTFYILRDKDEFVLVDKLKGLQYSFPNEKQVQLIKWPEPKTEQEVSSEK